MRTLSTKIFYVYEHWRLDTGVCFYVGKGQKKRAWKTGKKSRGVRHYDMINMITPEGMEVRLIAENLQEDHSFAIERERIAYWRSLGVDLVNMTDGGEGASGAIINDETKRKISASLKGRKHSPEHNAKIGLAHKGNKHCLGIQRSPENRAALAARATGRVMSEESKQKMSLAKLGKKRSPEVCKQLSASHKVRLENPEIRKQVSDRLKPYCKLPPHMRCRVGK